MNKSLNLLSTPLLSLVYLKLILSHNPHCHQFIKVKYTTHLSFMYFTQIIKNLKTNSYLYQKIYIAHKLKY